MPKQLPWRPIVVGLILLATIGVFIHYFATHTSVRHALGNLPLSTLLALLGLYILFTGTLAMVNSASLRLCHSRMPAGESVLLTMYSAVINFFGPLQSGPAFRALYLKQKYGVKIGDYTLASFIYYFFYAFYSLILLFATTLGWWLVPIAAIVLLGASRAKNSRNTRLRGLGRLDLKHWRLMALATALQVGLYIIIFWLELHAVAPHVKFSQVVTYTGAAQLALFVSITPGAIGFRESFLVFSRSLHHLGNSIIVAANIIDRAVYVAMLALLAVAILATHARERFRGLGQAAADSQQDVKA